MILVYIIKNMMPADIISGHIKQYKASGFNANCANICTIACCPVSWCDNIIGPDVYIISARAFTVTVHVSMPRSLFIVHSMQFLVR